jgi:hypothetical protein
MDGKCDYILPRPHDEPPRRLMTDEQRAASKAGRGGKVCGETATMKTGLNEDPYGAGEWCAEHAPPVAVSIEPLDPNKDHRQAEPAKPADAKPTHINGRRIP